MYDKQTEIMRDTIKSLSTSKAYRLDRESIKTLDDIKNVLEALVGEIIVPEGLTSKKIENLKDYLK